MIFGLIGLCFEMIKGGVYGFQGLFFWNSLFYVFGEVVVDCIELFVVEVLNCDFFGIVGNGFVM